MIVYKDFKDFEVGCFPHCCGSCIRYGVKHRWPSVYWPRTFRSNLVVPYKCIAREVIIERLHAKRPCPYFATICKPDIYVDIRTIDFEIGGETRCAIQGWHRGNGRVRTLNSSLPIYTIDRKLRTGDYLFLHILVLNFVDLKTLFNLMM